jgi:DNA-binding MarR family transcriptional regulator
MLAAYSGNIPGGLWADDGKMENESLLDLVYNLKAGCIAGELQVMEETGLSPAEYNGIAAINPGESISGSEVSRKMNLSPSRASRVIDKMVKNGYLIRENNSVDRRKCTISLAPKGMEIKKKVEDYRSRCDDRIRSRLTDTEMEAFSCCLKKIIEVI